MLSVYGMSRADHLATSGIVVAIAISVVLLATVRPALLGVRRSTVLPPQHHPATPTGLAD